MCLLLFEFPLKSLETSFGKPNDGFSPDPNPFFFTQPSRSWKSEKAFLLFLLNPLWFCRHRRHWREGKDWRRFCHLDVMVDLPSDFSRHSLRPGGASSLELRPLVKELQKASAKPQLSRDLPPSKYPGRMFLYHLSEFQYHGALF